jgi:uncharacterized protein YcbX
MHQNDLSAPSAADTDIQAHIAALWIFPVKSCAGVSVQEAEATPTGLAWDRAWMVVDEQGDMVSQRDLPRMALIQPSFKLGNLVLRAPGMLALHVSLESAEWPVKVRVWDDVVMALDMGDMAAQWFSDFLGADAPPQLKRLRLVRFDPDVQRVCDRRWTGDSDALTQFADGYGVLVTSEASLDELNTRLGSAGPVDQRRFRPNVVLGGVEAHDEDRIGLWSVAADGGDVLLENVKPCARCPMPDVNPDTGETGHAVHDALQGYRQDARLDGALTFGMNAVVRRGDGPVLRVGQAVFGRWVF